MVLARHSHILNAIELCKSPILIGLDTWTLVLNNHYYTIITWSCVNKEHMSICYDFPCFSLSNVTNWKFNALGITLDDNKFIKRSTCLLPQSDTKDRLFPVLFSINTLLSIGFVLIASGKICTAKKEILLQSVTKDVLHSVLFSIIALRTISFVLIASGNGLYCKT